MYRVLIVDDEPFVVHAIAALLEEKSGRELDLYYAYHAEPALQILSEGRIDLLLCDIRMPDMTGLELQRRVNSSWPLCRTVFLTAYSSFDYAYEALSLNAAGYILKSEPDDVILRYLEGVFLRMDQENAGHLMLEEARSTLMEKQNDIAQYMLSRLGGSRPFEAADAAELYRLLGFEPTRPLCFALAAGSAAKDNITRAGRYLEGLQVRVHTGLDAEGHPILCAQQKNRELPPLHLYIAEALECLQRDMQQSGMSPCGFLVSMQAEAPEQLPFCYASLLDRSRRLSPADEPFVYLCSGQEDGRFDSAAYTISFMREYIDQNITQDVSLLRLSALTGYNGEYLSRLFHRETGQMLSAYVSECRLNMVSRLLRDSRNLSLDDVALQAGFSSRSYFNRFIKKMTGLSPQAYRMRCVGGS